MRRILAVLFTLAPFVAGLVAALSVRHDRRMLWMAAGVTLVAWLALGTAPGTWRRSTTVGVAFVAASAVAVAVAVLLGGRAVFGIVAVAVVLAGCATAGAALARRVRPARSSTNPFSR